MLFFGMRQATEKKLSEMTRVEKSAWIDQLSEGEKYYFEERIAILCETAEPRPEHFDMAQGDVIAARIKQALERE